LHGVVFPKIEVRPGSLYSMAIRMTGIEFIDENGGGPGVRRRKRPPRK
jgi:hypothetical protein